MKRKPHFLDRQGLPAVFTYSPALAAGVSAERLYAYRRERLVDQIGRGVYRWAGEPEIDHDLQLQRAARRSDNSTDELIQLPALECFLDRLVRSRFAEQFVLKGGVLLSALDARRPRA